MLIWTAAIAALAVTAIIILLFSRSRDINWRYSRLARKTGRFRRGRNNRESHGVLKQVNSLAHTAITVRNPAVACRTIDLLKEAYGEGVLRKDEPLHLTAIVVMAVRTKQPDIAGAGLDAFRQLFRKLPVEAIPLAAEQLTFIAAVAMKDKYNFLAAKAAEICFGLLERYDGRGEAAVTSAALQVLKTVGILALRRRDAGLFREILTRLGGLAGNDTGMVVELAGITGVWLHRISKYEDTAMLDGVTDFVRKLSDNGILDETGARLLALEWLNCASVASLNPKSKVATGIMTFMVQLALGRGDIKFWELVAGRIGQTAKLALQRHEVPVAFPVLQPLLEAGRELLATELKFGGFDYGETFRQRALYIAVRESVTLAEFAARQTMMSTPADVIAGILEVWPGYNLHAGTKSLKRYCQLLLAYWLQTRSRQAKRATISETLSQPCLLNDGERKRLGFLL